MVILRGADWCPLMLADLLSAHPPEVDTMSHVPVVTPRKYFTSLSLTMSNCYADQQQIFLAVSMDMTMM